MIFGGWRITRRKRFLSVNIPQFGNITISSFIMIFLYHSHPSQANSVSLITTRLTFRKEWWQPWIECWVKLRQLKKKEGKWSLYSPTIWSRLIWILQNSSLQEDRRVRALFNVGFLVLAQSSNFGVGSWFPEDGFIITLVEMVIRAIKLQLFCTKAFMEQKSWLERNPASS